MTVNEAIKELHKLSSEGHGDKLIILNEYTGGGWDYYSIFFMKTADYVQVFTSLPELLILENEDRYAREKK